MAPGYAFDNLRKIFVRVDRWNAYESSREVLEVWRRRSMEVDGYGDFR